MRRCLRPGCPKPAKPKGDYCSDAHRAAAHKIRVKSGVLLPREAKRLHDREAKKAARAAGVIPSDVRLSYERTVQVLARGLAEHHAMAFGVCSEDCERCSADMRRVAEALLAPALPERLRPEATGG